MNLVEEGFEPYVHGAVSVAVDGEGARMDRMTARLLDYYRRQENWRIRAQCNAGVSIAFQTDSPTVDLSLTFVEGARTYYGLDVEVDGIHRFGHRVANARGSLDVRVVKDGDGSVRKIRVLLGACMQVRVKAVTLVHGSTVAPVPRPPFRFLALGDSITQGMDALSPCSPFPTQLARLLEADLINQGVGGHLFDPEAVDPESVVDPGLITVAYGTNDWAQESGRAAADAAQAYLEGLRTSFSNPPIAVIGPIWRRDWMERRGGMTLPEFSDAVLQSAACVDGVIPFEGAPMVPHQDWYFSDGVHPNDTGFLHYVMNLYRALRDSGTLAGSH